LEQRALLRRGTQARIGCVAALRESGCSGRKEYSARSQPWEGL